MTFNINYIYLMNYTDLV